MGQSVKPGRGLPHDSALLPFNVGALPHCLPDEIAPERLENTALHRSAPLTRSVRKKRPDVNSATLIANFRSQNPPMCKYAAHKLHRGEKMEVESFQGWKTNASAFHQWDWAQRPCQLEQSSKNQFVA
jgi:hypothetical protein